MVQQLKYCSGKSLLSTSKWLLEKPSPTSIWMDISISNCEWFLTCMLRREGQIKS